MTTEDLAALDPYNPIQVQGLAEYDGLRCTMLGRNYGIALAPDKLVVAELERRGREDSQEGMS